MQSSVFGLLTDDSGEGVVSVRFDRAGSTSFMLNVRDSQTSSNTSKDPQLPSSRDGEGTNACKRYTTFVASKHTLKPGTTDRTAQRVHSREARTTRARFVYMFLQEAEHAISGRVVSLRRPGCNTSLGPPQCLYGGCPCKYHLFYVRLTQFSFAHSDSACPASGARLHASTLVASQRI